MPKLKKVDTFQEGQKNKLKKVDAFQEGQKNQETGSNVIPDPRVDPYVVFYHTTWQPGVPEHVYKFKTTL